MFFTKPFTFIKETIIDDSRTLTSKEEIKNLLRVSLYRNAVYLMLNAMTFAASGFIFWIIAARFYTDVEVGKGAAVIAAIMMLVQISQLGLGFALIRFIPSREKDAVPLINSAFTLGGLASVLVAAVFLAGLPFWSPDLRFILHHSMYIAAFIAFTAAYTIYTLLNQTFIARRQTSPGFYQALIAGLLRFPLCYILAFFFASFGIFAAFGIAIMVSIAFSLFIFLPRVQKAYLPHPRLNVSLIGLMMARFAGVNYLANLFWLAPPLLFPIIVINKLGAEMNAYFYIGWAVANILFIIPAAIASSLFAEGSYSTDRLRSQSIQAMKLNLLILIPSSAVVILLGRLVLSIFGQVYAENATTLLMVLTVSVFPLAVNHLVISLLRVLNNLRGIISISLLITISTIGLSYLFMSDHGILGVGLGWLTGQVFTAVVGVAFMLISIRNSSLGAYVASETARGLNQ